MEHRSVRTTAPSPSSPCIECNISDGGENGKRHACRKTANHTPGYARSASSSVCSEASVCTPCCPDGQSAAAGNFCYRLNNGSDNDETKVIAKNMSLPHKAKVISSSQCIEAVYDASSQSHDGAASHGSTKDLSAPAYTTLTQARWSTMAATEAVDGSDPSCLVDVPHSSTFLTALPPPQLLSVPACHAPVAALSHSPSVAPPTPWSHSLRSPTPLDLTAPPKQRCPPLQARARKGKGREEESEARDSKVARSTSRSAFADATAEQSIASSSLAHLPATHHGALRGSNFREESEEDERQNARRLSFSGSTDERRRSHSSGFAHKPVAASHRDASRIDSRSVSRSSCHNIADIIATPPAPPSVAAGRTSDRHSAPSDFSLVKDEKGGHTTRREGRMHASLEPQPRPPSPPPTCPSPPCFKRDAQATAAGRAAMCAETATPDSTASITHENARHNNNESRPRSPSPWLTADVRAATAAAAAVAPPLGDHGGYVLPRGLHPRSPCVAEDKELSSMHTPPQQRQQLASLHHALAPSSSPFFESDIRDDQLERGAVERSLSAQTQRQHTSSSATPPLPPLQTPSLLALHPLDNTHAVDSLCVPQIVPTHDSVFFPMGTEVIAPVMLHYATVGGWSTRAGGRDYFNHRRLRGGEVAGHTVRWLHTAQPRDKFVFLVTPVENAEAAEAPAQDGGGLPRSGWQSLRRVLFGEAPWFIRSKTATGPRSCIACDDALKESSESDGDASLTGPSASALYEAPPQCLSSFPLAMSASLRSCPSDGEGGKSVESAHLQRSCKVEPDVPGSRAAPLCCMSPMLVTRQPSLGSASFLRSPLGVPAPADRSASCPTPLFIGLAVPASSAAAAGDHVSDGGSRRYARSLATPSTATGPVFPQHRPMAATTSSHNNLYSLSSADYASPPRFSATTSEVRRRASSSSQRFVFSPLTGTAVSTSGISPVTPRNPHLFPSRRPQRAENSQRTLSSPPPVCTAPPSPPPPPPAAVGVEVIEIAHANVTAMDYAPRLASHRLSIEARVVHTYFFPTLMDALDYYQCADAMPLMEEQWAAGMTSQIPRPQSSASAPPQQPRQQRKGKACQHQGSSVRSPSSTTAFPTPDATRADFASPPTRSGSASPVARPMAHDLPQHQPSYTTASLHRSPSLAEPVSLASALRSAGYGEEREEEEEEEEEGPVLAPTRLSRPHSFPSFSVRAVDKAKERTEMNVGYERVTTSLSATAGVATRSPDDHAEALLRAAPHPMQSTAAGSDAALWAAPVAAADTAVAGVPPTPSCPHHNIRQPAQPRLASTHREIVVSIYTADPVFNSVLRELLMPEQGTHPYTTSVADQKRLLSMVEVGMPAWAVFYSSTGLPYRRLFRLLYSGLTNLWPLLSLAVGVYDLYKHLPQLKRFMERTLDPLTRWLERRFTLRFSVLATYLISVVFTIFSSLSAFVSQFYVVQLFSLPIVQLLFALVKLPFVLAFDTVWLVTSTVFSTVSLVLQLIRVLVIAPVVFVVNVASLRETVAVVAPVAVQGTSLSVKWWKAWSEFWDTVASPMKNAVRAWWDSMLHVSATAARRETSIRRWYTPKVEHSSRVLSEVQDVMAINTQLWWADILQPGLRRLVVLAVALVYLYWLFLGISDKVWDDFIYASGVRQPSSPGTVDAFQQQQQQQHLQSPMPQQQRKQQFEQSLDASEELWENAVTPVAAVLHVLFQNPLEHLTARGRHTDSIAGTITTSTTTSSYPLNGDCAAATNAVLYTPTSIIQMCDSGGTSTIFMTTTQATSATPRVVTTRVTTITTVVPLPQASLTALAAELLLPNLMLSIVHHVKDLLWDGWAALSDAVAARSTLHSTIHQKVDEASASVNDTSRCCCTSSADPKDVATWATNDKVNEDYREEAPEEVRRAVVQDEHSSPSALLSPLSSSSSSSVLTTVGKEKTPRQRLHLSQNRRVRSDLLALVAADVRDVVAAAPEMMPGWAAITYLKCGDTRGQETMREVPLVRVESCRVKPVSLVFPVAFF